MLYQLERPNNSQPHQRRAPTAKASVGTILTGIALTAVILVLSGYALTTTPLLPTTVHIAIALTGIVLGWLVITGRPLATSHGWLSTAVAAILIITALFSALLHAHGTLAGALHIPVLILCGYLLTQAVPFDVFINWFTVAMSIFALTALAAWFFFIALELPLIGQEVTNFNGAVYHNGIINFLFVGWDGAPIDRSMGPFWEPGLFASFIVIALIFELSYRTRPARIWVITALLSGIVIAQSTAGYLLVVPVLALIVFKRRSTITRILAFFVALLMVVAFSQLERITRHLVAYDPDVFGKLEAEQLQRSSRMNIFELNLDIFSDAPIVGWGFEGANQAVVAQMANAGVAAQTSTSTYFLAALGIIGLLYTMGWLAILGDHKLSIGERIIILTCFLLILNKEPHSAILVTFVILFYFLSRVNVPRVQELQVPPRILR